MKTIGDRLKQVREQAGLKQKEMADFLQIGKAGYNRIEKGFIEITVKHLLKIAERFEVSLDWLLLGKEEKSDFDRFGEFEGNIKKMLDDMEDDKEFLHCMLSSYHQKKVLKSKSTDNDKDKELKHESN